MQSVLFVDMLGFARLVETATLEIPETTLLRRSRPTPRHLGAPDWSAEAPLIDAYTRFSSGIDQVVDLWLGCGHRISSVSFSDSAYIATSSMHLALDLAKGIYRALLVESEVPIPIRIGVAHGSFTVLRFRSESIDGCSILSAQFLGTGVVWAYAAAELSKIPGLRIFLHPSAVAAYDKPEHQPIAAPLKHSLLDLSPEQPTSPHVAAELNHLDRQEYSPDDQIWSRLASLRRTAPQGRPQAHYDATFAAVNRMRHEYGRPALP